MERVKSLLFHVCKANSDNDLLGVFVDPQNKVALAGHRRLYGTGDCLVRIRGMEMDMSGFPFQPFMSYYKDEHPFTDRPGLLGKEMPDGRRELVDAAVADAKFNAVFHQVNGAYHLLLNPKVICEFIEERTRGGVDETAFHDKKLNIEIFDGINAKGMFPGQVFIHDGVPTIGLRTPSGLIPAYIDDRTSVIPPKLLREGEFYIVERVGVIHDEQGPKRIVRVLREFKRGIRMAIQYFKSGLLLPSQPRYTVLEERGTGISSADILDLPFIDGQQGLSQFAKAPMMHFDLDTFYRAIKPMEMFKVVEMRFKDPITGVLLTASEPGKPVIDAIIGPTSPYKQGKVYTV